MRRLLLVLPLLLVTPGARADAPPSSEKKVVAVLPFSSPTEYNLMGRNAQETFVTTLVNTKTLRVVQSSMVLKMLRRHGLRWAGVVDPVLLKATGRWLKADYVLAGKLRYAGDAYVLSVHVMDVQTLETTMAEDVDFRDTGKMRIAVREAAKKIAGTVSGTGDGGSRAGLFLNLDPRAFYDTSDACIRAMGHIVQRYGFHGQVDSVEDEEKTVRVKGSPAGLPPGVPLDLFSDSGIDEPERLTTVTIVRPVAGGYDAIYRTAPDDGIDLGTRVTGEHHRWTVAVGKIEDEAEDNDKLVDRFRQALLEKMSEGEQFQQMEGGSTDALAGLSNRNQRPRTFKTLWQRGVDVVLEGKFYGDPGSRRAHFKIYSTWSGKLLGEPKFETSL